MRKVLVTGAAGRIGSTFVKHSADRYRFRLAVHRIAKLEEAFGAEGAAEYDAMELDFSDGEACRRACEGMDVVVHLGGNPSPVAPFYGGVLEANIVGAYNVFQAAKEAGCRRIVYASSIQAVDGYPLDTTVRPEDPVRPTCLYGVSKCFGEALAHYFAYSEGLSSVVVRIGTWGGNRMWNDRARVARYMSSYVSERDLCHLIVRSIETPDIRFAVVNGVSDNRFKRLDLSSTRSLLDYRPRDDAFKIFGVNLEYLERWDEERPPAGPTDDGAS